MRRLVPNLENCSYEEILAAEKAAQSGRAHRRLMAIRLFFEGRAHADILSIMHVPHSTLRTWIKRFNQFGIDGLTHDRERTGRPTKIPPEKHEALKELLRNPYQVGEDFWTARKLHGYLTREWQVELGYSTVCATMHKLGFAMKTPQPWPGERQNEALREAFREKVEQLAADEQVDLWYADETGIEGDPRPRRRWAERGVRTQVPYTGEHIRENVIGAVHPSCGELFAHVVPYVDCEWFQLFLDGLAEQTLSKAQAGRRIVLVLDNASWHKAKSLNWHHIEPLYLPPYSPDLNPIERLWLVLKARWFTNHICRSHEELAQRVDKAIKSFFQNPAEVHSICR